MSVPIGKIQVGVGDYRVLTIFYFMTCVVLTQG